MFLELDLVRQEVRNVPGIPQYSLGFQLFVICVTASRFVSLFLKFVLVLLVVEVRLIT